MPFRAKRMPVFFLLSSVFSLYLDRSDLPDAGFRRLRLEVSVFTQARHLHLPIEALAAPR